MFAFRVGHGYIKTIKTNEIDSFILGGSLMDDVIKLTISRHCSYYVASSRQASPSSALGFADPSTHRFRERARALHSRRFKCKLPFLSPSVCSWILTYYYLIVL